MTNTTGRSRTTGRTRRLSLASRTALIGGIAACTLVTGCSLPDWADMSAKPKPKPAAATSSQATSSQAKATPSPTASTGPKGADTATQAAATAPAAGATSSAPAKPRGDLKAGSLTRVLDAGSSKLVITYWTKQNPGTWTAGESVPVQFAAHLENASGTQTVYVSRFVATLDDGTSVNTISEDKGGFVITPPYSYSGAVTIHPADARATSADLNVEFDLLAETTPGSGQFYRQTVLDTVHLEFAR